MGVLPTRGDIAVSVTLAAVALGEIALTPPEGLSPAERFGEAMAALLICGCFAFRRLYPLSSALAVLLVLALVGVAWTESRLWDIAAVMLACYSCARHASRAGSWVVLAAATGFGLLVSSLEQSDDMWMYLGNFMFMMGLMVAIPWTAGRALRRRQELSQQDADRAVEDERARIARELHDIVGHALGMIVVQAEGERAQLSPDAPDSAKETLATIATGARDALDDVRRLLVVMRVDNDLGPQPGLRDVPRLLDGLSSAGLIVDYQVSGGPRQLPAGVDLSAYRVVQESLTNVLRHSRGARARVLLSYELDGIGIEVTDDGQAVPGDGSRGFGLLGIRERVALFGGTVAAGPQPGGGFAVNVRLPVQGGAAHDSARARV
jgi:signal transduction histidine kinase